MQKSLRKHQGLILFITGVCLFTATGLQAQTERPTDLPPFLEGVTLTETAPAGAKAAVIGSLDAVVGNVVVVSRQTQHGHWAKAADPLYTEDVVVTLAKARCRLTLTGKNVIAMGSDSIMSLAEHRSNRSNGRKMSRIEVLKGKVLFFVYRLFGFEQIDFQVTTPKMVAAVRGTKFGVNVQYSDEQLARTVTGLTLEPRWRLQMNAAGPESQLEKGLMEITHCEEGRVDVNGHMVAAGTVYDRASDRVGPLGSAYARAFNAATSTTGGDNASSADSTPAMASSAVAGFDGAATQMVLTTSSSSTTNSASTTTAAGGDAGGGETSLPTTGGNESPGETAAPGTQTEPVTPATDPEPEPEPEPDPEPTNLASAHGYYTANLTDNDDSSLHRSVITKSRVDFDSEAIESSGLLNNSVKLQLNGMDDRLNPYLKNIEIPAGNTGDLGASLPIAFQQMSGNDHLQWGYWTMTTPVDINDEEVVFDNKAYYVFGDPTPDATLQGMNGSAAYTGEAAGTFWSAAGGTDMTGSFVCDVDFDSGQVAAFNMSVYGGGKSATISGASGALSAGQFELSGGQWQLDGQDPHGQHAGGALYGPQAEHMGGAWQMRNRDQAAGGVFSGDKQ